MIGNGHKSRSVDSNPFNDVLSDFLASEIPTINNDDRGSSVPTPLAEATKISRQSGSSALNRASPSFLGVYSAIT